MGREKARGGGGGEREREREREAPGVHTGTLQLLQEPNKTGPPPALYLPLFLTYFPSFSANFKDLPLRVLYIDNRSHSHLYGSSQSTTIYLKVKSELVSRLPL